MKYYIITYGCQMNWSDSERIATVLKKIGYKLALKINEADLIIVNMCSVRQSAVDRVYGKIKNFAKLKGQRSNVKCILTGCILKKDKRKFAKYFNLILDIKDLIKLPKILNLKYKTQNIKYKNYLEIKPKYLNEFSAYVPIMTGCNNFCSYCVVPYVRGSEICRPVEEIIYEVKNLVKRGYKEIWLLGQNVNSYGIQRGTTQNNTQNNAEINFPKLLRMVDNITGDFWIRFTSSHPRDFSDELIEVMAKSKKITPYLNLPVQSGDNEILKKMNRPYTISQYKNLVKKIRKKIPNITLSTDAIVGFPGETKKQFQNTLKLFKETRYDMAYISQYSERSETAASKLKDNVPQKEKKKRWKELTKILEKTALKNNKKYIGRKVEVLVNEIKNGFLIGKTKSYKSIKIINQESGIRNQELVGQFVKAKVIDALPWRLKGTLKKK